MTDAAAVTGSCGRDGPAGVTASALHLGASNRVWVARPMEKAVVGLPKAGGFVYPV